jgi:hypothetical protein
MGAVSITERRCPDLRPVVCRCTAFMPNTVLPRRPPVSLSTPWCTTFMPLVTTSVRVCSNDIPPTYATVCQSVVDRRLVVNY